jgi:hypothetical protein
VTAQFPNSEPTKLIAGISRAVTASTPIGATAGIIGLLAFAWILLDSFISYFVSTLTGLQLPITAVLPLILFAIVLKWGTRSVMPPKAIAFAIAIGCVGFVLGPLLVIDIRPYRFIEIIGVLCTFAIGYFAMRWRTDERPIVTMFLVVTGLYVITCIAALHEISPRLFPVLNQEWSYRSIVVLRPEVMTDQNFQAFYFIPAALILALPFRPLRFSIALLLFVGGMYVLAKLQTRSGTLILLGTMLMCLAAPIWNASLGRGKVLALPLLLAGVGALAYQQIVSEGGLLLARLLETSYETGYERLTSLTYTFQNVYYPSWWVPHGNKDFVEQYCIVPHSNVTAMFLEGGIAGLYLWVGVFLAPMAFLLRRFLRGQLDPLGTLIFLGGTSVLILQLSLNVPFFKQPWLWAGAVVATLYRTREAFPKVRVAIANEA